MTAIFPDVPFGLGVQPVFRDDEINPIPTSAPEPLTADGSTITVTAPGGWGIYRADHTLALDVDSVVTLEPRREYRISDYPQEEGGFQTYNKVTTPGEVRLTVTKGGAPADRIDFLRTVEEIVASTDLFSIVTPERAFLDFNFTQYDYRRSAENGATLLVVDLVAIEVRQTAETAYTTTAAPSGADPVNGGPVRPVEPSDPVAEALRQEDEAEAQAKREGWILW